ncbi:hypothetical protein LSCM4_00015 [Leishmania orientalis]|uniref:Uncharacterized protein n=1 Tax=Leishmania orientalis TaxID=2249476 RepID=A0A836FL19_9TRYP|nr:hypothetical protein LSCM4_00015 [Leishmania orientalis]
MQQLQVWTCVLLLMVLCATTARGSKELLHGAWEVSTLVPGRGAVPPNYELTVQPGKWTVSERDSGRVGRFLDYAAARVGLVYTSVPSDEHALCHMPSSLILTLAAVRSDDGLRFECQTVWFTPSSLSAFEKDGLVHHRFDPAEPLYIADKGSCLATRWRVLEFYVARMGNDSFLFTGALVNGELGAGTPCSVHLEFRRRSIASATTPSPTSTCASIAMLLVVVAMRLLPRYILTRKGQLDKTSYRCKNPAGLTPAQRLQLLRRQREILEKMKAEDCANAAKGTTA